MGGKARSTFDSIQRVADPLGAEERKRIEKVTGLDRKPDAVPDPVAPPAPPSYDTAGQKALDDADSFRRRKGRASTILAGGDGALTPNIGTKQLLGA